MPALSIYAEALLQLGTVSLDGTNLNANTSKSRSLRYNRPQELRAKRGTRDIAVLGVVDQGDAQRPYDFRPPAPQSQARWRRTIRA